MNLKEQAKMKISNLEAIRKREDKTVPEFAEEIGVTTQTYLNWKKEKYVPSLHSLDKIDEFLEG